MKSFLRITLFTLFFTGVAAAQEPVVPPIAQAPVVAKHEQKAGDTVRISAAYLDSRLPLTETGADDVVRGFVAEADLQVFKLGPVRGSVAYDFQQRYNEEVYPFYYDPIQARVFDLYRNVNTHYAGAQLGLDIGHVVEPFIGYFVGTNKVHEDANRQVVSKVRIGANVFFTKESHFFVKAAIDFNRSYGSPNMDPLPPLASAGGFVSPGNRQVIIGAGFRF